MTVSFASRVTTPDGVLMRQIDNEAVILNLNSELYFGLSAVGTRMWTLLISQPSIQTAFDNLLDEYEVAPDRLRQDMLTLIETLEKHGLVKLEDPR
jgi:hypothetical protein